MKNLKFGIFCLGLAGAVGAAVVGLGAQDPTSRFEFRTPESQARGSLMTLDGRGSQLGVMVSDLDSKEGSGVTIDEVTGDSAAEKAGLRAGDVVVEYDGERVRSARQFTRLVQETPDGHPVKIAVLRNGQRQVLDATPEARAFSWNMGVDGDRIRREVERGMRGFRVEPPLAFDFRTEPGEPRRFEFRMDDLAPEVFRSTRGRLGVTVESLSPQLAGYFGATNGGALVSSVTKGSAAEKAGLKAGDVITSVNGSRVRDADSLIREVGEASGTELAIGIVRDKKEATVKAQIDTPPTPSRPRANSRPGIWM